MGALKLAGAVVACALLIGAAGVAWSDRTSLRTELAAAVAESDQQAQRAATAETEVRALEADLEAARAQLDGLAALVDELAGQTPDVVEVGPDDAEIARLVEAAVADLLASLPQPAPVDTSPIASAIQDQTAQMAAEAAREEEHRQQEYRRQRQRDWNESMANMACQVGGDC